MKIYEIIIGYLHKRNNNQPTTPNITFSVLNLQNWLPFVEALIKVFTPSEWWERNEKVINLLIQLIILVLWYIKEFLA